MDSGWRQAAGSVFAAPNQRFWIGPPRILSASLTSLKAHS